MRKIATALGIGALLVASVAGAATCRTNLQSSTPADRFDTNDEVVADRDTTLSWTRCAIGQHWTGITCAGEAQIMSWSEAVATVERFNEKGVAGQKDWRLPLLPELASIVERQCFNPRVNEAIFPGTPSEVFWSSMEKRGTTGYAYSLDFGGGAARAMRKDVKGAVRLVRGGPWWQPPKMMSPK